MIYKTLKKVSEYCQLLDKSKYPATQTVNGVTFTKVDGGYQLNGTCTGSTNLYISSGILISKCHKYLLLDNRTQRISNNYTSTVQILNDSATLSFATTDNMDEGVLFTNVVTKDDICNMRIRIDNSIVYNVVLLPQLFDLTEMYGAGNEPTTVEQFRQDFPEELYDYKPYCFVKSYKTLLKATNDKIITSYKKSLICTTKNLFDIPLTRGYPSNDTIEPDTKRTFTVGTYIVGLSRNNYYAPYNIISFTIDKNKIKITAKSAAYGISIPLLLTVGNTYTVSCKADNDYYPNIGITFYKEDGTLLSYTDAETITNNLVFSFTVPENTYYTLILFCGRQNNEYTFSNIQLEEGSTATEYHPYGYL